MSTKIFENFCEQGTESWPKKEPRKPDSLSVLLTAPFPMRLVTKKLSILRPKEPGR